LQQSTGPGFADGGGPQALDRGQVSTFRRELRRMPGDRGVVGDPVLLGVRSASGGESGRLTPLDPTVHDGGTMHEEVPTLHVVPEDSGTG